MNGFEKHEIKHLSASSINLWINAPDVWVAGYLFKKRTPMGPAPWRGICVEDAVVSVLTGEQIDDSIKASLDKFDKMHKIADESTTKERDMIEPMVRLSVDELVQYGKPEFVDDGKQEKIEISCGLNDDTIIPIIGYLDLVFPDHGLVIDLKTTNRMPSTMSPEHQLQRAIYSHAMGNSAVKFLYVTPKKTKLLEDGDVSECLAGAKVQIQRLEQFLAHCPDKETAAAIVPHNPNSFYWRNGQSIRAEIFNS